MIRHLAPGEGAGDGFRIASCLLLVLACGYGPLVFGSVLLRDRLLLTAVSALALALLVLFDRDPGPSPLPAWQPAFALLGMAVLGAVQIVPLPAWLAGSLAPRSRDLWESGRVLVGAMPAGWSPLSVHPTSTLQVSMEWLGIAACFSTAALLGRYRGFRRVFLVLFLALAIFEVLYGAERWLQRQPTIWGIEVAGDPGRLRGTFVNSNHFAFFLALPASISLAFLWWSARRLRYVASPEWRLLYLALPSFFFLTCFIGIAFSGSRGGLMSLAGALAGQTLILVLHYRRWRVAWVGVAGLGLGALGLLLFGWRAGLGRFLETSAYDLAWSDRIRVYEKTLELWQRSPWLGSGHGTFRQIFPHVQPSGLGKTWGHAHNDWLEVLATAGVLGVVLLGVGLVFLMRRLWEVLQQGRRSEERAAAFAAMGALIASFLHSFVDFGLAIPGNSWTLALLCGLAYGAPTLVNPAEAARPSSSASRSSPHGEGLDVS